jgi:hypothetical protein
MSNAMGGCAGALHILSAHIECADAAVGPVIDYTDALRKAIHYERLGSSLLRCVHDGLEGSGASADPRRAKCRARLNDVSGKGDRPFALEGPSSETAIGLTQHELPLPNPMGELDTGDRDRGSGK